MTSGLGRSGGTMSGLAFTTATSMPVPSSAGGGAGNWTATVRGASEGAAIAGPRAPSGRPSARPSVRSSAVNSISGSAGTVPRGTTRARGRSLASAASSIGAGAAAASAGAVTGSTMPGRSPATRICGTVSVSGRAWRGPTARPTCTPVDGLSKLASSSSESTARGGSRSSGCTAVAGGRSATVPCGGAAVTEATRIGSPPAGRALSPATSARG